MHTSISPDLLAVAISAFFALLAAVFHAGVRYERVDNVKHGITLEVRNLKDNNNQRFDRVELRLTSQDRQLTEIQGRHASSERWQGGVDTKLETHEGRLDRLEQAGVV